MFLKVLTNLLKKTQTTLKIIVEILRVFIRNQPSRMSLKCYFKRKYVDQILPALLFVFIQVLQLLI